VCEKHAVALARLDVMLSHIAGATAQHPACDSMLAKIRRPAGLCHHLGMTMRHDKAAPVGSHPCLRAVP